MEKLLQWAVNNSDQEQLQKDAEAVRRGEYKPDPSKFDPRVIEAILGKDDATLMKEAVQCISDPNDTMENKEVALDNLEMLVEGIDNAKNIQNMGLWPVLIQLLQDQEHQVRTGVAWICGTALQNNPDAQKAFLEHQGLPHLITMLKSEHQEERAKAQYAISGLLKHCSDAVDQFKQADGFQIMATMLKTNTEDATTLRKVIFLYNTLMVENTTLATELINDGLVDLLDDTIVQYTTKGDEDMVEKALRTLLTAKQHQPDLVKLNTTAIQAAHDKFGADNLNLDKTEWATLLD